ncbi:MAG: hypothetical protein EZS28_002933 [Streblomastix strix]|uniref:Uncharacterized protein n=1 Tax=Streblomastix strix TaxID=222440 RepID=A0A5J4X2H1_9EUKA|nr:MAG: hypothetical protein EZS28_002933 [Streblomastix strix]
MASCANAVKYSMAYNEFKVDGDYSINTFDPPFYLTPQYWKAKVEVYEDYVKVIETDNVVTNIIGLDFNSLYPSVMCSQFHPLNPYTNHKMFMAGTVKEVINVTEQNKQRCLNIINSPT